MRSSSAARRAVPTAATAEAAAAAVAPVDAHALLDVWVGLVVPLVLEAERGTPFLDSYSCNEDTNEDAGMRVEDLPLAGAAYELADGGGGAVSGGAEAGVVELL